MAMKPTAAKTAQLQALLRSGFQALTRGQTQQAGEYCRQALGMQPDLVEGHFLVGLVALEMRDRRTALSAFGSVTRLQPDHAAAWAQLAKLFIGDGQLNRADAALDAVARADPSDPMVCDLVGTIYTRMGEHDSAQSWYGKAIEARPDHPPYLLNYANNLVYHGETDAAVGVLRHIIAIDENNPQAHWVLASAQKARDRDHVEQMRGLLASHKQHPRLEAFYHYAIGKELEDLQAWDEAFEAFHRGASVRRETVEYDEAAEVEMFAFLEERFTADWVDDGSRGNPSGAPIFVLGQPRTGTTLIERIITSHSQVHSAGELQQFGLAVRRLAEHMDPRRFSKQLFEAALRLDCAKVGTVYMESTKRVQGDTPHFVDKLPQNYFYVPMILKALPNSKIVHLTRDPMDACFASYKQLFADAYLHSYDLEEMARHHVRYRRLMDTWRERFPGRFLDISYEETVSDLEPNARRLIEFLGLPWEDACLRFHEQKQAVSTASAVQVREPVHTRSIGRWRKYEKQLQPMRIVLEQHGLEIRGQAA
jgi:cytochrome c-type biogenesis protein CcmH/NrfG